MATLGRLRIYRSLHRGKTKFSRAKRAYKPDSINWLISAVFASGCLRIIEPAGPSDARLEIEGNPAPVISTIADQSTPHGTDTGAIAFTVSDPDTDLGALILSVASSNQSLVPDGNITLGGTGASRTLSILPLPNQTGTATITVSASDGTDVTLESFDLVVRGVDLEFPIEMSDYRNSSTTTPTVMDLSAVGLDTADYDGTVSYTFEVVAMNNHATIDAAIYIIDSADNEVATVAIPASTADFTRFVSTFTPNVGADVYRVKLGATPAVQNLWANSFRIRVRQSNATKTKLYVPLAGVSAWALGGYWVERTRSLTYAQVSELAYPIWLKETGAFTELAASNPFTLDAVLHSEGAGATATLALFNRTTGNRVTEATVSAVGTAVQRVTASFGDTVTHFTNGDEFELRVMSSSGASWAYLQRAGLWVKLDELRSGITYHRLFRSMNITAAAASDLERITLDSSRYSNPLIYFETSAAAPGGANAGVSLLQHGLSDSGTAGATSVVSSPIVFDPTKSRKRSPALTITDGNRFILGADHTSGTGDLSDARVLIKFSE